VREREWERERVRGSGRGRGREGKKRGEGGVTTPGPSNLNQKSAVEDFDNFWQ